MIKHLTGVNVDLPSDKYHDVVASFIDLLRNAKSIRHTPGMHGFGRNIVKEHFINRINEKAMSNKFHMSAYMYRDHIMKIIYHSPTGRDTVKTYQLKYSEDYIRSATLKRNGEVLYTAEEAFELLEGKCVELYMVTQSNVESYPIVRSCGDSKAVREGIKDGKVRMWTDDSGKHINIQTKPDGVIHKYRVVHANNKEVL